MNEILVVTASARGRGSLTRALAERFEEQWRARRPEDRFTHRDVGRAPPPFVTEAWIAAAFTAPAERTPEQRRLLAVSDELIEEVTGADVLVVATPMYNYGMPAALKAWLDQVVRIGRTFSFDLARGDEPLRPTLTGKRLLALTSAGEFGFEGGPRAGRGHLLPHLRTVAGYLGAETVEHIGVEYQEFRDERHAASKAGAFGAIPELVRRWA